MNLNCIICSDLLTPSDDAYSTPCGHIFHYACLIQWMQRSKSCPQCRNKCSERNIHRIFFNVASSDSTDSDPVTIQHENDNLILKNKLNQDKIGKLETELQKEIEEKKSLKDKVLKKEIDIQKKSHIIDTLTKTHQTLKAYIDNLKGNLGDLEKVKLENEQLSRVKLALDGTNADVDQLLRTESDPKTLAVLVSALKRELRAGESRRNELKECMKNVQRDLKRSQDDKNQLNERIAYLESENYRLTEDNNKIAGDLAAAKNNLIPITVDENGQNASVIIEERKRKFQVENGSENSPTLPEKVKKIQESDSPYLNLKSSSIGLGPMLSRNIPSSSSSTLKWSHRPQSTSSSTSFSSKAFNGYGAAPLKKGSSSFSSGLIFNSNLSAKLKPIGPKLTIKKRPGLLGASRNENKDGNKENN